MKRLAGFGLLALLILLVACSHGPNLKVTKAYAKVHKSKHEPVTLRYQFKVENTKSLKTMDWESVKLKIKPDKNLMHLSQKQLGYDVFHNWSAWGSGFECPGNKYCDFSVFQFLKAKHKKKQKDVDPEKFKQNALHAKLIIKQGDKTKTVDLNQFNH